MQIMVEPKHKLGSPQTPKPASRVKWSVLSLFCAIRSLTSRILFEFVRQKENESFTYFICNKWKLTS